MKRVLAVAAITGAAVLAATLATQTRAASTRASADIPVLRVGLLGSVSNLDPARAVGAANNYLWMTYDGLVRLDQNGALRPWLAREVKHPNPHTWVYVLRRGVRFSDGKELTATDVANAMNYYRFPQFQTAFLYRSVRSITAVDKYTIKVDLKYRDATWPYTPARMSFVFQKAHADANPGQWGRPGVLPVSTGPWMVASLDPTRGAELVANDRYWGGRPQIRRLSIKFFSDETSLAVAMRSGDIDLAFPTNARTFSSTSGTRVASRPSCAIGLLSMNTNVAPWNDVNVRRAIAYAVNRAGIANALGGDVRPEQFLIPQRMWGATGVRPADLTKLYKSLPTYSYDLAKARQELGKSRFPNGFSATTLVTSALNQSTTAAQVIAADLAKIGIRLELKNVTVAQWVGHFFGPRPEIGLFVTGSGCANPDPSWYPGTFLDSKNARQGSTNIADYKSPRIDALLQNGRKATNPAARLAAYGALLRAVQNDVPYVALYTVNQSIALADKFRWPTAHQFAIGNGAPWPLDIKPR